MDNNSTNDTKYWSAFGSLFFLLHQGKLLWLLNAPVIGRWFRRVLRISGESSSVGHHRISRILPNAIFWWKGVEQKVEFRTHNKFSKRLYYAFAPLWDLYFALQEAPCASYGEPEPCFGKAFFERRQPLLVYLLNNTVTRGWFRWVLCIHGEGSGVGSRDVVKIAPNAIWWRGDTEGYVAEFRTHAKFSKRLYFAFRPLWWTLHTWDWAFADRWVPELSFGFSTLTAYPDAHTETNTVDGTVWHAYAAGSGVSLATLKAAAGSAALDDQVEDWFVGLVSDTGTNNYKELDRYVCLFDTSGLPSGASKSAGVLSLYGTNKVNPFSGSPSVDIYTSAPASDTEVVAGDFNSFGSVSQTGGNPVTYANWANAYNAFTLDATGRGNIPTGAGAIAKFGLRETTWDVGAGTPTWASATEFTINGYHANQTGTANDPKLTVVYTLKGVLTAYPDAHPETNTVDGLVRMGFNTGSGLSWANMRDGAGNEGSTYDAAVSEIFTNISPDITLGTGYWRQFGRYICLFDTSALTSVSTISAGVLSLYGTAKIDPGSIAHNIDIYTSNPASNTAIANGDFDSLGTTSQTGAPITYANWSVVAYNDFTFDATGRGNISKTSISKFGARNENYDVANTEPTWWNGAASYLIGYHADQTGTRNDPKLVVTYTLPSVADLTGTATASITEADIV